MFSSALLLCCLTAGAVGTQPSAGDGSQTNPYQIATLDNLLWFADYVNSGYTTVCAELTADITMNANVLNSNGDLNSGTFEAWTPIGSWYGSISGSYNGYSGEFNGNGHTISGLYFNDETTAPVGLFGMTNNTGDVTAYIHDVGVRDSYFRGKSHVAGICGDLANGRLENCWSAATVQSAEGTAGGIVGSCWHYAFISGCYNTGKVAEGNKCGGVCGSVAKNVDDNIISLSNCASLEGKCSVAYNLYEEGVGVSNIHIKNAEAFAGGEVCWILNGNKYGGRWRQQLGTDACPIFSSTNFVNYTSERQYYNNEPTQEIRYTSTDGKIVTPSNPNVFGANINYNTYEDGQGIITFDNAVTSIGLSAFRDCSSLKSMEIPDNVTSIGDFAFRYCSSLQSANIPISVTSIERYAFLECGSLQSIIIPSGVTSIGQYAFSYCNSLATVTFNSLPVVGTEAFWPCAILNNRILDLTDSYKPFIGSSLDNYPEGGFTEARYHGTLEPGEWGTIVLPFVPSSHSGIVFFAIDDVDAESGTLTLSITENIEAGKPYLFRNQTEAAGFTLTALASNVPVTITASEQASGNFALKGTFQAKNLTENGLYEQQGNEFVNVSPLSIDPFHAYLKDNGSSAIDRIVIEVGILVKITNQDGSTITLGRLKKVEFIKQGDTPAVRVTNADNSTTTYLNPKKVDFGKD